MSDQIVLKVNILDGNSISVSVPGNSTVYQLMTYIKTETGISEDAQKLLYLGRVLDKEKVLADYSIHDGVCIQLIKFEAAISVEPESRSSGEEMQTIQTSYVVYLPFRITETATVPASYAHEPRSMSEPTLSIRPNDSQAEQTSDLQTASPPLEGAPPVPRYSSSDIPLIDGERSDAVLSNADMLRIPVPPLHSQRERVEMLSVQLLRDCRSLQEVGTVIDVYCGYEENVC